MIILEIGIEDNLNSSISNISIRKRENRPNKNEKELFNKVDINLRRSLNEIGGTINPYDKLAEVLNSGQNEHNDSTLSKLKSLYETYVAPETDKPYPKIVRVEFKYGFWLDSLKSKVQEILEKLTVF